MRGWLLGALAIAAAPLLAQSELSGIQLDETPSQIRKIFGESTLVADINPEFRSWLYRTGNVDHDDYSHTLVFRNSTNSLVSFSRTFETPTKVEALFPPEGTTYHHYPETGPSQMVVRVHRLSKDRLLLAFGSAKAGDPTDQLILIYRSVLKVFYPWLAAQLD